MRILKKREIKPGETAYIPVGITPDGEQVISLAEITEIILISKDGQSTAAHYAFTHRGRSVTSPFAFRTFGEAYAKGFEIKEKEAAKPKPPMTARDFAESVSGMIEETASKYGLDVKCGVIGPSVNLRDE